MQVKRQREDFMVREITQFSFTATGGAGQDAPGGLAAKKPSWQPSRQPSGQSSGQPSGQAPGEGAGRERYAVYRLDKSGLGTPEAASEILSTWNLRRRQLNYGGLKDRHAITSQTITIFLGPAADIEQDGFTLTYLGQAAREFTANDIEANEFDITLRELSPAVAAGLQQAFESSELAIPNYFDEQRFGSLGESGQYIAQPWCLANYEQALFLAIAEENRHDRPDDREQKEILRQHWGDWQACKDRLERSHRRSIVTYLVDHPTGFKKAVALIRQDLRGLYVAAFQAKLWNEMVTRRLAQVLPDEEQLRLSAIGGQWIFPRRLDPTLRAELLDCQIPLPSGRQTQWPPHFRELLEEVLAEFGIERHKLRFSHPRDVFFSRGLREMWLMPQTVSSELGDDEFGGAGTCKLRLVFRLHPGQYATMLIKGLELHANHIHSTQENPQ